MPLRRSLKLQDAPKRPNQPLGRSQEVSGTQTLHQNSQNNQSKTRARTFRQIVGAGGDREAFYNPPRPLRRAHGRAEPGLAGLNHPYIPLPAPVAITARLPPGS